jgi:hypothetical protein
MGQLNTLDQPDTLDSLQAAEASGGQGAMSRDAAREKAHQARPDRAGADLIRTDLKTRSKSDSNRSENSLKERYATRITYFPRRGQIPRRGRTSKIPKMVLTL